jgi:hypothetical protein
LVIRQSVMRGLDPRVHDELPQERPYALAARHHGLPYQARQ